MSSRSLLITAAFILIALLGACGKPAGGPAIVMPSGIETMAESADGASIAQKYFPGMAGRFFHVGGRDEEAPVFGLIHEAKDPGKVFLAGAGSKRSWSEAISLESPDRTVTAVVPETVAIGDLRKDGQTELLLVLTVESQQTGVESGGKQTRTAAYLFELDKRLRLVWYQTLHLKGQTVKPCGDKTMVYSARPAYRIDAVGRLEAITVTSEEELLTCGKGADCKEERTCSKSEDRASVVLIWDEELHGFAEETATELVLQVPDVVVK
jgi:hypothetical protein